MALQSQHCTPLVLSILRRSYIFHDCLTSPAHFVTQAGVFDCSSVSMFFHLVKHDCKRQASWTSGGMAKTLHFLLHTPSNSSTYFAVNWGTGVQHLGITFSVFMLSQNLSEIMHSEVCILFSFPLHNVVTHSQSSNRQHK